MTVARGVYVVALAIEVAWAVAVLVLGSNAGLTVTAVLMVIWGGVVIAALAAVRALVTGVRLPRAGRTRRAWIFAAELALIALVAASVWFGVAFRVRFFVSLPWLTSYARSVASHAAAPTTPRVVGLFRVREVEVLPEGVVRLITTPCMFDDCGMVFSPRGRPPVIGEDSYRWLGLGWWHWWRSW